MTDDPARQLALMREIAYVVLSVDVFLIALFLMRRRDGRATYNRRWSVADLWFGIQLILLLLMALLAPLIGFAYLAGVTSEDLIHLSSRKVMLDVILPSAIVQNIPFFLVPAEFINLKYRLPLRAIGLPALPRKRDWTAGILLGFLGMALSGAVGGGIEALAQHFQNISWVQVAIAIDKNNPVAGIEKTLPHLGALGLILAVLGVGVAAPIGEEMLFRGFAFNILKRRFGLAAGIVISALLFTLPHSYGLGLAPVFVLGALMAWTYNNSGSLWVTIILHATNNTIQVLLAFFFPALMR